MRWTITTLPELVHSQLYGRRLVVIPNREPYIHTYADEQTVCEQPASHLPCLHSVRPSEEYRLWTRFLRL